MTTIDTELDVQIKSAHRSIWASGDYPAVASEVIPELGAVLIQALGVQPNDKVLDVAAGSGNAAIPAAQAGAHVTATDLAPELFNVGRHDAARAGVAVSWLEADAERLPFDDRSYDLAMSAVGVMFTPSHQRSADELVRVVRPGGRIGLINWTPRGFIGQMFTAMKPYAAAPPAGAQSPPLWGDPDHVARLLGNEGLRVADRTPPPHGRSIPHPRGLPRLLQEDLRADDRGVRQARERPHGIRRARRNPHGSRSRQLRRPAVHAVGVPTGHGHGHLKVASCAGTTSDLPTTAGTGGPTEGSTMTSLPSCPLRPIERSPARTV